MLICTWSWPWPNDRNLDNVKIYLHTKNEVPMRSSSKVIAWTDRHTDMTKSITYPHLTLILKLDLDMVKMYLHTKPHQKWTSYVKWFKNCRMHRQTDRQTDRHDRKHHLPTFAGGNKIALYMNDRRLKAVTCFYELCSI